MSSTVAASSSSASSPRCVPFAFRRGSSRGRLPALSGARTVTHGGAPATCSCGRPLCRPAEVLGQGIQNAFFVSLDVCSCVTVRTDSFRESSESEAAPLMIRSLPPHDDSGSPVAGAAPSGTRRRASAGAGKPRRGLGCCTVSSTSVN